MRTIGPIVVAAALTPLLSDALTAQRNEDACGLVLDSIAAATNATFQPSNRCFQLAGIVVIDLTDQFYGTVDVETVVSPRDIQPTTSGGAGPAGSPAQGDAVPTSQPLALAGGSVAAVGTDAGADAITSITINPAIFFTSPADIDAAAKYTRLTDLTVFFPVSGLDGDDDGDIDYFGIRWRVNMTGVARGNDILERAQEKLEDILRQEFQSIERIESLLAAADDPKACVEALLGRNDNADQPCDGAAIVASLDRSKYEEFRHTLAAIREEADSKFIGLDIRIDVGDPTLGAVPGAEGISLLGGIAFGKQFVGDDPAAGSAGVKGRLGLRYVDLKNIDQTDFALDGGLAFEARRPLGDTQSARLSGGFEFRYGDVGANDALLQSDYLLFRAAVAVPVAGGTAVSISVAAPLIGDVSPTLSVNLDWGLLLPEIGSLVRR